MYSRAKSGTNALATDLLDELEVQTVRRTHKVGYYEVLYFHERCASKLGNNFDSV